MMGPSAVGAQPPPEELDEWENPTVHDDPDEPCEWDDSDPFCNCSAGHSIEETDWNQCDSCGKPIYDEEPAVSPAPTSCRSDGRCQYAIDHGAEELGHCPPGKCVETHNAELRGDQQRTQTDE